MLWQLLLAARLKKLRLRPLKHRLRSLLLWNSPLPQLQLTHRLQLMHQLQQISPQPSNIGML